MSLDCRTGGATSESFVSATYADDYLETVYGSGNIDSTWSYLSEAQKELRLMVAAELMGYLPLRGRKSYRNQRLVFPRIIDGDDLFDGVDIPDEIKEAQVLLAYLVIHRGMEAQTTPSEGVAPGRIGSVSIGGLISVSFAAGPRVGGTALMSIIRSSDFPIYAKLRRWLSQVRIRRPSITGEAALTYYTTTTT